MSSRTKSVLRTILIWYLIYSAIGYATFDYQRFQRFNVCQMQPSPELSSCYRANFRTATEAGMFWFLYWPITLGMMLEVNFRQNHETLDY